ncbi:MAG: hypothetical protein MK171_10670 [Pirellulales bacterium]|nr:hypothetical protein [Pirellulales bacterium]
MRFSIRQADGRVYHVDYQLQTSWRTARMSTACALVDGDAVGVDPALSHGSNDVATGNWNAVADSDGLLPPRSWNGVIMA